MVDQRLDRHAHADRAGLPAARDDAAEEALARRLRVDVEGLRIVLARELDDLGFAERMAAELGALADLEVSQ